MPHVIVKLYPGGPEDLKQALATKINQAVIDTLNIPDEIISVAIEEVAKDVWDEQVKEVDIVPKQNP
jgi:4-oxalocrotonate tautomerase family enzyme